MRREDEVRSTGSNGDAHRPRAQGDPTSLAQDATSAFLHAPIAVAICQPDGVVTRTNDALTRLLGHPGNDLVGRDLFRLVERDLVDGARAACAALQDGSRDTVVHETRFRSRDGRLLDVRVTTAAVRAPSTSRPHLIMHLEDITDREDLRRRLQHEASHDPLTGLNNRNHFLQQLQRALPRGVRHEQPVTILYLDLDHFKIVNDTHGHATGDRLLKAFGSHVRTSIRPEDTAARLGGDEFAVLCENTTAQEAALIATRLTDTAWTAPFAALGSPLGVTVGAATSPPPEENSCGAEQLLHQADAAMYLAKARRRSTVRPPVQEDPVRGRPSG